MIDKNALQLAIDTAQAAARTEIVRPPMLPDGWFYWHHPDGSLVLTELPRHPRNYHVEDLDDYAAAVARFAHNDGALVLCGETCITAILDEADRARERLRFGLTYTTEFQLLKMLAQNRTGKSHPAFLKMLRIELAQCAPQGIIERLRSLKFQKASSGQTTVKPGDEAISHEIKRCAIVGDGDVPESVGLDVRIYNELPDTHVVECCIDLDLDTIEFCLIPLSGELETACYEVRRRVRKQLQAAIGDIAAVYCGQG